MTMPRPDRDANAALRNRLDEVYQRYTRMRDGVGQLQRRLSEMEVTLSSPDKTVLVTVGPQGRLIKVRLSERAYQHRSDRLAELITETVTRAQASVAAAVQQLMRELVPDETGIGEAVASGDVTALLRRHDQNLGYTAKE